MSYYYYILCNAPGYFLLPMGRLPWERPVKPRSLNPIRVLDNYAALSPALGTLSAGVETPRTVSRKAEGQPLRTARRCPAVKKSA